MYQPRISRRTVLRGLGASIALPFLPSLAWAEDPVEAADRPPRRFVTVVNGDGYHPSGWWARGGADGLELGETLQAFGEWRSDLAVLTGLNHKRQMARVHGYGFTTMLSCAYAPSGKIQAGVSIDQILAREFGRHTPIPSLVFGIDPVRGGYVNGAPSIYQATCSWSSPTTPVPPEHLPQQAFKRLFDLSALERDQSILDFVLADANQVRRGISTEDRHKFDEFFTSVREIEQRIERTVAGRPPGGWQPTLSEPDLDEPAPGVPESRQEHCRLMMDLLVLALQMDKTRVANLILMQDFSSARFTFLDGVGSDNHHSISHHSEDPDKIAQYRQVNRFQAEQVAYLCGRLDAIDEGHGTSLLDNTLILYGSCMYDGNTHVRENLPLVLLGGRSHGKRPGLHDFSDQSINELGNLHLTIARRQGLQVEQVGEGTLELAGLFA